MTVDANVVRDIVIREVRRMVTNTGLTAALGLINNNEFRPDWTRNMPMRYSYTSSRGPNPCIIIEAEWGAIFGVNTARWDMSIIRLTFEESKVVATIRKLPRDVVSVQKRPRSMQHKQEIWYDENDSLMKIKDLIYDTITSFLRE